MHSYIFHTPIAITAGSGPAFMQLLQAQAAGTLKPDHIEEFRLRNKVDAFHPIQGKQRLIKANPDKPGAYIEWMMWAAPGSHPDDTTKQAMLTVDIIPDGAGLDSKPKFAHHPRQWMLGSGVQALLAYQMSCCPGVSAIASFKQQGRLIATLLENARFVTAEYQDLFGLLPPKPSTPAKESGVKIDHHGGELSHWRDHITGRDHECGNASALKIPGRLILT